MRLTILQITPELETGGVERTAVDVAAACAARGWRAIVASEGGRLVEELGTCGGEHITLPLASKNPVTILINAWRLFRLIRAENVSLVHARSRAPAWSALIASRMAGVPFVTTYHGAYNQTNWLKGLYNSVMARADVVIANSGYTADLIRSRHAWASNRVEVVHRGTPMTAYAPGAIEPHRLAALRNDWKIGPQETVILQLARLTAWKGQRVTLEAFAALDPASREGRILVLAGDAQGRTDYLEGLKALARDLGIEDSVRFPGHCADVPAAMQLADVAVVSSVEPEAFGRAAVEAQAAGTPVIVSDLGAVPETVLAPPQTPPADRTGWRVPPGDAVALSEAMREVLGLSDDARADLVQRARAHVAARFTLEVMCDATLAIYERLCGTGRG